MSIDLVELSSITHFVVWTLVVTDPSRVTDLSYARRLARDASISRYFMRTNSIN